MENKVEKKLGKKLTLREIQLTEYDILKAFAEFCDKNNLRYYITGGTLLGAVRHKGFIPWDDDVDVNMPRPDYDHMLELSKNGIGQYKVDIFEEGNLYFAKVVDPNTTMEMVLVNIDKSTTKKYSNVFIDICPLEGLPSNKIAFKLHALKVHVTLGLRGSVRIGYYGNTAAKKVFRFVMHPVAKMIGDNRLRAYLEKLIAKYKFEDSDYIGALLTKNRLKDYLSKEKYLPQIDIQFEDGIFKTTQMYKEHLTMLYGKNYMEIPPKEAQNSGHQLNAWSINTQHDSREH